VLSAWHRVLLTGVGGQGVLSAGRWIGEAAHAAGQEAVVGQLHGLSQRGGAVECSVVVGGARSAEIPAGGADVLVAFEPMEAARGLSRVSRRTVALVNTRPWLPGSLQSAGRPYPALATLLDPVREAAGSLVALDATTLAEQAGSSRALNVVLLGLLAALELLPLRAGELLEAVVRTGAPAFERVNRSAFHLGHNAASDKRTA